MSRHTPYYLVKDPNAGTERLWICKDCKNEWFSRFEQGICIFEDCEGDVNMAPMSRQTKIDVQVEPTPKGENAAT